MNFKKISSLLYISGISALLLTACDPDTFEPEGIGSFSVTNAAPGSPTVDVVVDGKVTSPARLNYGNTTISQSGSTQIYLPVLAGAHDIKISVDTGKTHLVQIPHQAETGKIHSFFIIDTVMNNALKVLRLDDDLTLPATGNAHIRALHLAPRTGAVDVTFTRGTDSVTISNLTYAGTGTPNITELSMFRAVPAGSYTVKVKTAGTQTVLLQAAATLATGRIYTFYARGGARSQPVSIGSMTNY